MGDGEVTGETTHDDEEADDDMEYDDAIAEEDEGLDAVVEGLETADLPETSHLPPSRTTQSV